MGKMDVVTPQYHFNECIIAWDPKGDDRRPDVTREPRVKVGRWPDLPGSAGWSLDYLFTHGACWGWWHSLSTEQGKTQLFILFNRIVLDGVPPLEVHRAFLQIIEYQDGLGDGIPGLDYEWRNEHPSLPTRPPPHPEVEVRFGPAPGRGGPGRPRRP